MHPGKDNQGIIMYFSLNQEIRQEFVKDVTNRCFYNQNYIAYFFSAQPTDHYYLIKPSEFSSTPSFNNTNGWPIPIPSDTSFQGLRVSPKNYWKYLYGRGGYHWSVKTLLDDHRKLDGIPFLSPDQETYWQDQLIIFCGNEGRKQPLIFFIIFADSHSPQFKEFYNGIILTSIDQILKWVEDTHHQQYIFPAKSMKAIENRINLEEFQVIKETITSLPRQQRTPYLLRRLYYDFFIENMVQFPFLPPTVQEILMSLNHEFEKNQEHLFKANHYRDHYLHQTFVFLLGTSLINTLHQEMDWNIINHFNQAYRPGEDCLYSSLNHILLLWFLTSMFHDIAYPIEKSDDWITESLWLFLHPDHTRDKEFKITIDLLSKAPIDIYQQLIKNLATYRQALRFENSSIDYKNMGWMLNPGDSPLILDTMIPPFASKGHEVISALMLLDGMHEHTKLYQFLYPAASAISVHNTQWLKSVDLHVSYTQDPLAFLLILSDLLHDWGRYNYQQLDQAFNLYHNPCELADIEINNSAYPKKIIFKIKLKSPNSTKDKQTLANLLEQKKKQVENTFSSLCFIPGCDIVIQFFNEEGLLRQHILGHPGFPPATPLIKK